MKIEYNHTIGLPRKMVWKYCKDEQVLKNSIPGCRSFTEIRKGLFQAEIDIHLGPVKDVFTLQVRVIKEIVPSYYQAVINGKGKLGEVNGKAELHISDMERASKLNISADIQVTGTFAGTAERMLNNGANKGIENFIHRMEREIKRNLYHLRKGKQ